MPKRTPRDQVWDLRDRIQELEADNLRMKALIDGHNEACIEACGRGDLEGVKCGYRPYFPRHCPACPLHDIL